MKAFDSDYMKRVDHITINDDEHFIVLLIQIMGAGHKSTVETFDLSELYSIVVNAENTQDIDDLAMQLYEMRCTQRALAYTLSDQNDNTFIDHEEDYALYTLMRAHLLECSEQRKMALVKMMQEIPKW